jgi:eukaryotic-like serine/threonine-protein kinase
VSEHDELIQRAEARVGLTLNDKWRLDRLLGVGGMASVYAATHRNQKRVAVKVLHGELSRNTEARARFLREGYLANTVRHSGVVMVDDDDVLDDGSAFLVMELLEGENLDARQRRHGGTLPVAEVLAFAEQVLGVLVAAHEKGIVHRDLKPENLFVTASGEIKVLDFGIARQEEAPSAGGEGNDGGPPRGPGTRVGIVLGTPTYMAPEQARARWDEVDGRTDLWALGATMFVLLSGRLVHEAGPVNEELGLAITAQARSLATAAPHVPPAVAAFVDRALAFDKAARWPDAQTMLSALRDLRASLPEPAAEASSSDPPPLAPALTAARTGLLTEQGTTTAVAGKAANGVSGRRVAMLAAAAALLLVVGAVVVLRGRDRPPDDTSAPARPTSATEPPAAATEPPPTVLPAVDAPGTTSTAPLGSAASPPPVRATAAKADDTPRKASAKPAPVATAAAVKPPPAPATAAPNPFDRRY